jgi:hypothetical protein
MTEDTPMIALDDADFASLKAYAEVQLGLEIKTGMNGATIRAKIKTVAPETTHIPGKVVAESAHAPAPVAAPKVKAEVIRYDLNNPNADPKAVIKIHKTADGMRARDVTVSVNHNVWQMQRGVDVTIPYRVLLALRNAVEMRPVLTGETNQFGMPEYEYQEVISYPFDTIELPTKEEIERWHRETSGSELKAA